MSALSGRNQGCVARVERRAFRSDANAAEGVAESLPSSCVEETSLWRQRSRGDCAMLKQPPELSGFGGGSLDVSRQQLSSEPEGQDWLHIYQRMSANVGVEGGCGGNPTGAGSLGLLPPTQFYGATSFGSSLGGHAFEAKGGGLQGGGQSSTSTLQKTTSK